MLIAVEVGMLAQVLASMVSVRLLQSQRPRSLQDLSQTITHSFSLSRPLHSSRNLSLDPPSEMHKCQLLARLPPQCLQLRVHLHTPKCILDWPTLWQRCCWLGALL